MKYLKNIILTERDLRSIISDNILSEKRFYSYDGPRRAGFQTSGEAACSVAGAVGTRISSDKARIKAGIILGVGVDDDDPIAKETFVSDPIRKSESAAAIGSDSEVDADRMWKMTIGYADGDGPQANKHMLALFILPKPDEITIRAAETAEDDEGDEVVLTPAVTTPGSTLRFILRYANSDGSPITDDSGHIAVDPHTGAVTDNDDKWFKSVVPIAFEWMARYVNNVELCDERTRASISRRSGRTGGTTGVYAAGALALSSWWDGDRDTGLPVRAASDIEAPARRVLVVSRMTSTVNEKLEQKASGLRRWRVDVTESGTHVYLIPTGTFQKDNSYATSAREDYSTNKARVGSADAAMRKFGSHGNFKTFLQILTKVCEELGENDPGSTLIDMSR